LLLQLFLVLPGLRLCFVLVLPCSLALGILAEPLTVSLFQYGQFDAHDALMRDASST
jgi:putative peptidoglycan lipid II flippase